MNLRFLVPLKLTECSATDMGWNVRQFHNCDLLNRVCHFDRMYCTSAIGDDSLEIAGMLRNSSFSKVCWGKLTSGTLDAYFVCSMERERRVSAVLAGPFAKSTRQPSSFPFRSEPDWMIPG